MVVHSVHDMNPARLNAIMPALQRMEEDPAFLERTRHRFDNSDPPPPYSSGSITRLPTPDPFQPVANSNNLDKPPRKPKKDRIEDEYCKRDENRKPLYHGPSLHGRAGQQRLRIMIRHSIKKRWERLGVWQPEWGIPRRVRCRDNDEPTNWCWRRNGCWKRDDIPYVERKFDSLPPEVQMASWPSLDEEHPSERAVRLYLKERGEWDETLDPPPPVAGSTLSFAVDDRDLIITRPWFMWHVEIHDEEMRLRRHSNCSEFWHTSRRNVATRWKEKGCWKDSWGDEPGWRWRHESPSPEPPDPSCMEFTPCEIDAFEEIPPPSPRPAPNPVRPMSLAEPRTVPRVRLFEGLDLPIPPLSTACRDEADADVHIPEAAAHGFKKSVGNRSTVSKETRPTRQASRALVEPSKISKPTQPPRRSARIMAKAPRRSARIMAREQQLKNAPVLSNDKKDPPPQRRQRKSPTKAIERKKARTNANRPAAATAASKPRGVTKRKGRSRA
ncbi:predicted protein [Uncinocarpus reesii 1704]|uniref:Uncharacterized protein n=1 Tax=Uncinocarpus reesii (strain UAMH 1704) TaxID=336963 RepID=C4JRJ7_UNCRE|nr:uncharacterized protein UREG_05086 [Uncinocarpus reesii 1704]EEP80244.1 predicted protein [Uncinocarpus reesii 1704]